jgi:hypothetical protein
LSVEVDGVVALEVVPVPVVVAVPVEVVGRCVVVAACCAAALAASPRTIAPTPAVRQKRSLIISLLKSAGRNYARRASATPDSKSSGVLKPCS